MAYNSYSTWLTYRSSSPKLYFKDSVQEKINQDFMSTINCYEIKIKDRFTGVFVDSYARVENSGTANDDTDDFKKVIFSDMDYEINTGDIYEFGGYRWIVIQPKSLESATSSCIVQKCNCILKFTESTPLTTNIIEIDCVATNRIVDSLNKNIIDIPIGHLSVIMPLDYDSMKIRLAPKPTRFLLGMQDYRGQYKAYEVENIDTISNSKSNIYATTPILHLGITQMLLKETQTDTVKDDHTVGVAYQRYF